MIKAYFIFHQITVQSSSQILFQKYEISSYLLEIRSGILENFIEKVWKSLQFAFRGSADNLI